MGRWAQIHHCGCFWKIQSATVIIHVADPVIDREEEGWVGIWEGDVLLKCQGLQ